MYIIAKNLFFSDVSVDVKIDLVRPTGLHMGDPLITITYIGEYNQVV